MQTLDSACENREFSGVMPQFTKESAAIAGKRGNELRWSPEYRLKSEQELAEAFAFKAANTPPIPDEEFRNETLTRVRGHLKKVVDRIDAELDRRHPDSKVLRDLGDFVTKLEAVEQRLSNRPLPGSLKPTSKPSRRGPTSPSSEPEYEG